MWGECCHQKIVTPFETDLNCIDEVFAKFASPSCSWQPFRGAFVAKNNVYAIHII